MKRYVDFVNEIDADMLYKSLLGYGLFSEKVPPMFSTESFYEYCINNNPIFPQKPNQYLYYENIRNINIPRSIGIPTPMSYQRLCACLRDNWGNLKKYFKETTENQRYRVSRIHVRKMRKKCSIFEMNYSNWRVDGSLDSKLSLGKKYVVSADIANCFSSIYTHSITWALAGKNTAKQNRRGNWYNDIDQCVQNTKDQETHGILIGPHAFNIISEIILCAIDEKLVERDWKYIRHIDDYTCFVETEELANKFLVELQSELRSYDLSLNHKKTKIEKLPIATVEGWIRKINSVSIITNYGKVDYKKCRDYLDYAIEISKEENGNSSVLKYAIKVLSGLSLTDNAKIYEYETIFHLCLIYGYLVPLLDDYVFITCQVNLESIEKISNMIYSEYMPKKNYEAVSYALYYAIKYNFTMNNIKIDELIQSKDAILLVTAFKYYEKVGDKLSIMKLKEYARTLKNKDDFERMWLFTYEILPKSDLSGSWKELKEYGISFIKEV